MSDPKKETTKPKKAAAKTSKTARVLGLLTSPPPTEEPASAISRAPAKSVPTADQTVEAQVRSALEEELGDALSETPAAEPEAAPEPASAPNPPAVSETPMPEPVLPVSREDQGEESDDSKVICFNMMQALVEAKADKYIRLFGLCPCPRCRIDVIALSLTNLPAKYVVASNKEVVPLLSVYEGKYNAAIVSQVMNACKRVMEHPRHNL